VNGDGLVGLVRNDVNEELGLDFEGGLVGETHETDLVDGIRSVGDQLTEENLRAGGERKGR
jgi:hypothetical protein